MGQATERHPMIHHDRVSYLSYDVTSGNAITSGPEVIKLEYSLKLKIKHNDWLLADMCPQAANHCALF